MPPARPSKPFLSPDSDTGVSSTDNLTGDSNPTFVGQADANVFITLFDGDSVVGSTQANTDGVWAVRTGFLPDGIHIIEAQARNAAGEVSVRSASTSITIDSDFGTVTLDLVASSDTGLSATDNVTSDSTPTFIGLAKPNTTITLRSDSTIVGSTRASPEGVWILTSDHLNDGSHEIFVEAEDIAGNLAFSVDLTVDVDTQHDDRPNKPVLSPASDTGALASDFITSDATPTFTGFGRFAEITLSEGSTVLGHGEVDPSGRLMITVIPLLDGVHSIFATGRDLAGNATFFHSESVSVTIDTVAPAVPATPNLTPEADSGRSSTDNVTSDTTPTFTGSAEANATITLFDGAAVVGSAKADVAGFWTATTGPLVDGSHAITARATDLAGNISAKPLGLIVTIDSIASAPRTPTLEAGSDTGRSSTDNITSDTTPTFSGLSEAHATVNLFDRGTMILTTEANAAGFWTATTGMLASGSHAITVQAIDVAGNVSAKSAPLSVTIDNSGPLVPSKPKLATGSDTGVSSTDNLTSDTTPTFTGLAEANATVSLFDGAAVGGAGGAVCAVVH